MRRDTEELFFNLQQTMATAYNARSATENFSVTIPMAIALNQAIQDSSDFLKRITILPVTDSTGQPVRMNAAGRLAKRTNTAAGNRRQPTMAGDPNGRLYKCEKTEFDVGIAYALLDAWARFDNFQSMYMETVYKAIALDRILIGWYGESVAVETDSVANPLLQDVNKGWLFDLETNNPAHFLTEGEEGAGVINLGAGGHWQNLDQAVYDVGSIIPEKNRTGEEVAIIGRELVSKDTGKVYADNGTTPSEKIHFKSLDKSYGSYDAVMVPGFPARGIAVTDPKNLHIYFQESAVRRKSVDEPEHDRVADYISSNEAYICGDLEAIAAIDASKLQFV